MRRLAGILMLTLIVSLVVAQTANAGAILTCRKTGGDGIRG